MRLLCFISVCFRLLTAGWYLVTKGKILSLAFFVCFKADCLAAKLTPERDLSMIVLDSRVFSGVVFEELALSSLIASPLMKLFFTVGGWHELKCVY